MGPSGTILMVVPEEGFRVWVLVGNEYRPYVPLYWGVYVGTTVGILSFTHLLVRRSFVNSPECRDIPPKACA